MRRTRSLDLVPIDLDTNKTLRKLNKKHKQQVIQEVPAMGDENHVDNGVPNRVLKDYYVPNVGVSSIRRPPIQANNFEIKLAIIQMIQSSVQFGGLANVWTHIFHVRPHSIDETRFLFICEKLIFEKKLESPLILFLF